MPDWVSTSASHPSPRERHDLAKHSYRSPLAVGLTIEEGAGLVKVVEALCECPASSSQTMQTAIAAELEHPP